MVLLTHTDCAQTVRCSPRGLDSGETLDTQAADELPSSGDLDCTGGARVTLDEVEFGAVWTELSREVMGL